MANAANYSTRGGIGLSRSQILKIGNVVNCSRTISAIFRIANAYNWLTARIEHRARKRLHDVELGNR